MRAEKEIGGFLTEYNYYRYFRVRVNQKSSSFFYVLIIFFLFSSDYSFSQYFSFGRNKVQYEKFSWKLLKTEHFDVYYYDGMGEIGEIGAKIAENAYTRLQQEFEIVITRRIPLIFYNTHLHFQQTNTTEGFIPEGVGGFFEFMKGRVVIPYLGSMRQFNHVINHELVHVFMMSKIGGLIRDRRIATGGEPPLWFTEGLAEFLSIESDDQAQMVMRDALVNGYFTGLKDIYRVYGSFIMYKEGQAFLEYVKQVYGKKRVLRIIENFCLYDDFDKVLEYTLNKKIDEIDKDWTAFERRKYFPLVEQYDQAALNSTAITKDGYSFNPKYYSDSTGVFVYFTGNMDGYSSVYRIEKNKSDQTFSTPKLVIRGERSSEYEALHLFSNSLGISSTGTLAFITKSTGKDIIHLYSTSTDKKIGEIANDSIVSISSPSFSKAGDKLLFQAIDNKGFSDIFMYDFKSDVIYRLTNDYYDDQDPVFLSDNYIVFSSDRQGSENQKKYNLYKKEILSGELFPITNLSSNCTNPFLKNNSDELFFVSDEDGVKNVYKTSLSSTDSIKSSQRVTSVLTGLYTPSFFGQDSLVFTSFDNVTFKIYIQKLVPLAPNNGEVNGFFDTLRKSYFASLFDKHNQKFRLKGNETNWFAERIDTSSILGLLPYKEDYSLDYAQSQVSTDPVFGTRGGAVLSISDLLGDDKFFFVLYNTAEVQSEFLENFNVELFRLKTGERANYGYGIFNYRGRRYDLQESSEYFYEKSYGGYFLLQYPISTFDRIEAIANIANTEREIIYGIRDRGSLLLSNSISYVYDNSLWGLTGPVDGVRLRFGLGLTEDIRYSNTNYYTAIADARKYFRIGKTSTFAVRGAAYINNGNRTRRYFMGGSWDLRGWDRFSLRGEKIWISSAELRFPLIEQVYIKLPVFGLALGGVRGALFFDAGSAWDNEYSSTFGSLGFGFRFNLFNILVLRYDMGKKIEENFTKLQPGLFYQFFFGWDF